MVRELDTRQLRVLRALLEECSVTQAARACGYTPSTFIARYRAEFGITPGREAHQLRA